MLTSGCTAWAPNAAAVHVASGSMRGPWKPLGNPARGAGAGVTFRAQGSFVLPLSREAEGEDEEEGLFLFVGDKWNATDLANSAHVWLPLSVRVPGAGVHAALDALPSPSDRAAFASVALAWTPAWDPFGWGLGRSK
mmetsp:Transcript_10171/g.33329  ORF Transcript_10171/g.33329 Transcript_10171/m.33329 type:complete len:137 (+) Transcript_10171:3-413(+)